MPATRVPDVGFVEIGEILADSPELLPLRGLITIVRPVLSIGPSGR